ncbi:44971_t:CDS:2 [Gigaspora margarita]|uniref:44971_t:CDS:1 n=1 Tax=Gigaspora margarita TaxID=4874 RepID=A0ABN7UG93_GIGMA|nr:44971_t:CDS:2 [Gigaspora margarita]
MHSFLDFLIRENSSISAQSVIRWNKEISKIHMAKMFNQKLKKCQQQTEFNDSISIKENLNNIDGNHEESANKLFEDLFGRK